MMGALGISISSFKKMKRRFWGYLNMLDVGRILIISSLQSRKSSCAIGNGYLNIYM